MHDISALIKPADMLWYVYENNFALCEAEKKYPFLLHQRLYKICAVEYFGLSDEDILSAIECHTTLKKCASRYDMPLFIADKLAWDREGVPPFYEAVDNALDKSLESACYRHMEFVNDNNMMLHLHGNRIAAYEQLKRLFGKA